MEGVKNVKKSSLNSRFVFIQPPSLQVLEARLRGRGSDDEQAIKARLEAAQRELAYAEQPGAHDKVIVNDSLDKAYTELESFVLDSS
jgi:guanylate kinase